MIWALHIVIILGLGWLCYKKIRIDVSPLIFWSGMVAKLCAGIVLGLIFSHYYDSGDTFTFFQEAKKIAGLPLKEYVSLQLQVTDYSTTEQPRLLFFSKLLSVIVYLSGGSYWISTLYFSLISFSASWYLVAKIIRYYPALRNMAIVCFLFIPSIVFWSSGILKDTLAFTALVLLTAYSLDWHHRQKLTALNGLMVIISIFILLKIKHYLLITFMVFIALWLIARFWQLQRKQRWIALSGVVLLLLSTQWVHPYLTLDRIPLTLYENNQAIIEKTADEDQLDIVIESADWPSVLSKIPVAIKTGLFRPSIFDETPYWGWIHRIENLLLTFLITMSVLLAFKLKPYIDYSLLIPAVLTIGMLATFLALSTPNFGTLVRYKNAFMPYLFLITSILPYRYFTSKAVE